MNFNEKLIRLRKEKGLSQEELGYKLNVTRQTVSKWELGQTIPEMDKLVKIANFFKIGVNELVNDGDIQINKKDETKYKSTIKIVLIVLLVLILIIGIVFGIINIMKKKNEEKSMNMVNQVVTQGQENMNKIMDYGQNLINQQQNSRVEDNINENAIKNQFNDVQQMINEQTENMQDEMTDQQKQLIEDVQIQQQQLLQQVQ